MTRQIGGTLARLATSALVAGALALTPAAALAEASAEEAQAEETQTTPEVESEVETTADKDGSFPDIDYATLAPEQLQQLIEDATTELVYRSEAAGGTEGAASDATSAATELGLTAEQYELLINPSEDYVLARVSTANGVSEAMAATEDNDPNSKLHRQGGYTSDIFFKLDAVDHSQLTKQGDPLTEGTAGGGCVEVYATAEYAQRRDTSLGAYDGTTLSNGSHHVYGTCVIRISEEITASQQAEAEAEILRVLTANQAELDAQQAGAANPDSQVVDEEASTEQRTIAASDSDETAEAEEQGSEALVSTPIDAASPSDDAGETTETSADLEELASRVASLEERVSQLEANGVTSESGMETFKAGKYLIGRDIPAGLYYFKLEQGHAWCGAYENQEAFEDYDYFTACNIHYQNPAEFSIGLEDGMYLEIDLYEGDEGEEAVLTYSYQPFYAQSGETSE